MSHLEFDANTPQKAYWVQVSGASLLAAEEIASSSFEAGSESDVTFDDVADASRLRDLIRAHPTRVVDNYILDVAAQEDSKIHTALIFPPIVYGRGEGPVNQRSIQIPALCRSVVGGRGGVVQVGRGLSRWGSVHVKDIARVFVKLANAGANGSEAPGLWGENGLFLPSIEDQVRPVLVFPRRRPLRSIMMARIGMLGTLTTSLQLAVLWNNCAAHLYRGGSDEHWRKGDEKDHQGGSGGASSRGICILRDKRSHYIDASETRAGPEVCRATAPGGYPEGPVRRGM